MITISRLKKTFVIAIGVFLLVTSMSFGADDSAAMDEHKDVAAIAAGAPTHQSLMGPVPAAVVVEVFSFLEPQDGDTARLVSKPWNDCLNTKCNMYMYLLRRADLLNLFDGSRSVVQLIEFAKKGMSPTFLGRLTQLKQSLGSILDKQRNLEEMSAEGPVYFVRDRLSVLLAKLNAENDAARKYYNQYSAVAYECRDGVRNGRLTQDFLRQATTFYREIASIEESLQDQYKLAGDFGCVLREWLTKEEYNAMVPLVIETLFATNPLKDVAGFSSLWSIGYGCPTETANRIVDYVVASRAFNNNIDFFQTVFNGYGYINGSENKDLANKPFYYPAQYLAANHPGVFVDFAARLPLKDVAGFHNLWSISSKVPTETANRILDHVVASGAFNNNIDFFQTVFGTYHFSENNPGYCPAHYLATNHPGVFADLVVRLAENNLFSAIVTAFDVPDKRMTTRIIEQIMASPQLTMNHIHSTLHRYHECNRADLAFDLLMRLKNDARFSKPEDTLQFVHAFLEIRKKEEASGLIKQLDLETFDLLMRLRNDVRLSKPEDVLDCVNAFFTIKKAEEASRLLIGLDLEALSVQEKAMFAFHAHAANQRGLFEAAMGRLDGHFANAPMNRNDIFSALLFSSMLEIDGKRDQALSLLTSATAFINVNPELFANDEDISQGLIQDEAGQYLSYVALAQIAPEELLARLTKRLADELKSFSE